jgi:predicted kinase
VIEKQLHLDIVERAIPDARIQIAWLDVPPAVVAGRLGERERGSALQWHIDRAEEIRRNAGDDFADFRLDADRDVRAIAVDLLDRAGWV